MVRALLVILGVLVIVLSLSDVFQAVIVPRSVGRTLRPSFYQSRWLWRMWPRLAYRIYPHNANLREDFLAAFAPFNLLGNLATWSILLLLGYGMIFYALRDQMHPELQTFGEAVYFAGTSFFTIGFGDFTGSTGLTRMISLAAGASGFGLISAATAYLFAIFGAFQTREQFVVMVGARAGIPPSGVGLLTIAAHSSIVQDLPTLMRSAEMWCAAVMETHLAYPVLAYFRSSHDGQSWVGTLGTLLDAAVLLLTTVDCDVGESRILYSIGGHTARDLAVYFHISGEGAGPGITREEYNLARKQLGAAGLQLRNDEEGAWEQFADLRSRYAAHLKNLAAFFRIPPLPWISEQEFLH